MPRPGTGNWSRAEPGTWALILPGGRELAVRFDVVPTHGCDHRHEVSSYEPSERLRRLVQVRDQECTFPPCSRPAQDSDFDMPSRTTRAEKPTRATPGHAADDATRSNSRAAGRSPSPSQAGTCGPPRPAAPTRKSHGATLLSGAYGCQLRLCVSRYAARGPRLAGASAPAQAVARQVRDGRDVLGPSLNLEIRRSSKKPRTLSRSTGPEPGRSTMNSVARSPNFASGTPTTAASAMPGCSWSSCSTSPAEMFSPPRMMISLVRPVMASSPARPSHHARRRAARRQRGAVHGRGLPQPLRRGPALRRRRRRGPRAGPRAPRPAS